MDLVTATAVLALFDRPLKGRGFSVTAPSILTPPASRPSKALARNSTSAGGGAAPTKGPGSPSEIRTRDYTATLSGQQPPDHAAEREQPCEPSGVAARRSDWPGETPPEGPGGLAGTTVPPAIRSTLARSIATAAWHRTPRPRRRPGRVSPRRSSRSPHILRGGTLRRRACS